MHRAKLPENPQIVERLRRLGLKSYWMLVGQWPFSRRRNENGRPTMEPTHDELKNEIENGPLAPELAPFWADVFGPHHKSELAWRIGILTPDAAFEIRKLLIGVCSG
jgi:hypothetical protein